MNTLLPKVPLRSVFIIFFSAVFQAFGMYHIHSISALTEGGFLGLTLLLDHWFSLSPAISGALLNIACYFIGWRTMGKDFLLRSFFAAAVFEQFPPVWPGIAAHPLLGALIGALFVGIGSGICVLYGAAICGDDALAMSMVRLTHIPIERIYLVSDMIVLLLSLTYIPFSKIAYSLLTVVLSGQIIGFLQKPPFHKTENP